MTDDEINKEAGLIAFSISAFLAGLESEWIEDHPGTDFSDFTALAHAALCIATGINLHYTGLPESEVDGMLEDTKDLIREEMRHFGEHCAAETQSHTLQ